MGYDWKWISTILSVIVGVLGVFTGLDVIGARWWVWKYEFEALSDDARELQDSLGRVQQQTNARLSHIERTMLKTTLFDLRFRLNELRERPEYANRDAFLMNMERDLEQQIHDVQLRLEKL